jgi:hypothetical protein
MRSEIASRGRRWEIRLLAIVLGAILLVGCAGAAVEPGTTSSVATDGGPSAATPAAATATPTPGRATSTPGLTTFEPENDRAPHGVATRLLIPSLDVDLPVIEGPVDEDGNPLFPPCDVALYLDYYVQPGAIGTTYLYAHARRGMLLPLLEASQVDEGSGLIGEQVIVYTADGWRHEYELSIVRPHATDYSIADDVPPGDERLVVQTSEGRVGDPLKLQVAGDPIASEQVDVAEALASPNPRECGPLS